MRRKLTATLLTLLAGGCTAHRNAPQRAPIATRYAALAVALGEDDPDSLDFAFDPAPAVEAMHSTAPRPAEIAARADALSGEAATAAMPAERKQFFALQLRALAARARMTGGATLPFAQEAQTLFDVGAVADDEAAERERVRARLAQLLSGTGDLAHRYTELQRRFTVPQDRVPAVMQAALEACRTATLAHVTLPAGEHVTVEYVGDKAWSAYSRYHGGAHSTIQVNLDYPLTVDRILNLACHEGYPGHHVFNTLRDESLVIGRHEEEWMVQPTFSPQAFVSEAAASYAPELVFTPQQRVRVEQELLCPKAGLSAAQIPRYLEIERLVQSLDSAEPAIAEAYLDGRLEFVRAADALRRETLMEHGETMLLYLNEYRSYMLAYTVGRRQVQEKIERGASSDGIRWQRYLRLARSPEITLDDR